MERSVKRAKSRVTPWSCCDNFRYAIISKETWPKWRGDLRAGIKIIMNAVNMDPGEYQLGKTKVFVKTPESVSDQ